MWETGVFALRPLEHNADMIELGVEWYWQPTQSHELNGLMPMTTTPLPSHDLAVWSSTERHESTKFDTNRYYSIDSYRLFIFFIPKITSYFVSTRY
jgi:hypothetical protein